MKRILKLVIGWLFLILGVIGLFTPVLQGVLFIIVGLTILGPESPWARRQLDWLRRLHPEWAATFEQGAKRAAETLKRVSLGNGRRAKAGPDDPGPERGQG